MGPLYRVCRNFQTKEIFDVYDFYHGRTFVGNWGKLPFALPSSGWVRVSNAEHIFIFNNCGLVRRAEGG